MPAPEMIGPRNYDILRPISRQFLANHMTPLPALRASAFRLQQSFPMQVTTCPIWDLIYCTRIVDLLESPNVDKTFQKSPLNWSQCPRQKNRHKGS